MIGEHLWFPSFCDTDKLPRGRHQVISILFGLALLGIDVIPPDNHVSRGHLFLARTTRRGAGQLFASEELAEHAEEFKHCIDHPRGKKQDIFRQM